MRYTCRDWYCTHMDVRRYRYCDAVSIDCYCHRLRIRFNQAFNTKTLDSKIGFKGILKKLGILCIVALAVVVDRITGESGAIRTLVIYYFVANEGLSVLENLSIAGLPIPASIKKALQALKKESK